MLKNVRIASDGGRGMVVGEGQREHDVPIRIRGGLNIYLVPLVYWDFSLRRPHWSFCYILSLT